MYRPVLIRGRTVGSVILVVIWLVPVHDACPQGDGEFDPADCFDKTWRAIRDEFWDPEFNGLDWEDARARYGAEVAKRPA